MGIMHRFNLQQVKANLERTKRELPMKLSAQAENHFAESFTKGGLDEYKWKEVNRRIDGTKEYKYKPKGISESAWHSNPILVGTGTLRRKVARSAVERTFQRIRLQVDLPYAAIHNEGSQAGRNHASTIPARPFMKQTVTLTSMQTDLIREYMDKIWNT
jgi:phage gpG-like protein